MSVVDPSHSPDDGDVKMKSQRERRRNLEILKYGRSLRSILQLDAADRQSTPNLAELSPRLALDATLTGFAQLVAMRMSAKRAFICLNDGTEQHIIAEATQSISLFNRRQHAPDDDLMFGVRSIPHEYGISSLTLQAYRGDQEWWSDTEITFIDASRCIMTNLQDEPRVRHLPFTAFNTTSRFYAEVPIQNTRGMIVGVIGVLDTETRVNPTAVNVQPMQDVARLVAEHLELVRLKDVTVRAERLMQALGHFNKGKSSISRWTMDNPDQALATDEANHRNQVRGQELTAASIQEFSGADTLRSSTVVSGSGTSPSIQARDYFEQPIDFSGTSAATTPATGTDRSVTTVLTKATGSEASTITKSDASRMTETQQRLQHHDIKSPSERPSGSVVSNTQSVFSRASNLLRESMDLEAACFLGISADGRFNTNKKKPLKLPQADANQSERAATTAVSSDSIISSTSNSELDSTQAAQKQLEKILCNRIAFSTRKLSSLSRNIVAESSMTMPEASLKRLVSAYPTGHIFNFDAHGAISSGDDSSQDTQSTSQRRKIATAINTAFMGATSVVFIPLYDNERQHLYAAFFGWIDDPFRVLLQDEAIYISGFANSIMCEVMRLEALALDKAKSDFMSSISHELRSPLHGILAATQLMHETRLSPGQSELALMVDDCGRSLLDIMNNLLEHAKINNIIDKASRSKKSRRHKFRRKEVKEELVTDLPKEVPVSAPLVDLATVVEETVASVAAGYLFKENHIQQRSATKSLRHQPGKALHDYQSDQDSLEKTASGPLVIVDIEYRDDWFFEIDTGTWRRIVMNLVGNAMKYTKKGYVNVALYYTNTASTVPNGSGGDSVVLTISDTGQGISETYMKHRLYTPFAQENNLSVGVGLGLSIVDRLVAGMGGKIHIESEVNIGTRIMVTLPLRRQPKRPAFSRQPSKTITNAIVQSAQANSKVHFVGFDIYPALSSEPTGTMSLHAQALLKLKQALTDQINAWFGLSITPNSDEASLYIIEKSHAVSVMTSDPGHPMFDKKYMLINAFDEITPSTLRWRGCYTKLSVPIGPRKLARAVSTTFQQQVEKPRFIAIPPPSGSSVASTRTVTPVPSDIEHAGLKKQPSSDAETVQPSTPNSCRLMLVEDNNINLRILAQLVRKLRFPFVTASNGQEAVDRYKESHEDGEPITFIFMDISMPIMDGLTSTRHIRAYEQEKGIRKGAEIVALTGLGHEETQREAIASGVDQYHRKPVDLGTLRELLKNCEPATATVDGYD